ncbi:hypothetical protein LVY72_21545 [Arthrobacter sp. I2-34]|uniref:Uncharacterized protein n=1 Tax=Arthrobacter hankyongi TaxID=2904801 RepID=A0ABS9LCS0_9MICC|nr:hypothetical protein [Arthrobacter hankyongi]MCG2624477.1 hypothetical protein [Arthrobacter hankyongi]
MIKKISSINSGMISSTGRCGAIPALLTITSNPLSRSATFTDTAIAAPPLPPSFWAALAAVSMFRSAIAHPGRCQPADVHRQSG